MLDLKLLEESDIVEPEDYCRPLYIITMSGGLSDNISFKSCYTGAPENNVKWVKVKYILGKSWHYKTVKYIDEHLGQYNKYEFVRGQLPNRSILDLNDYIITDYNLTE